MKIVISGTPASGKSSVAKLVAKKLGLRHFSMGDFQRELAKEHGVDIVEWGRLEAEDEKYDRMVDEKQEKIGKEHNDFVIDSWLGAHFIKDAVKFFIDANLVTRAQRRLDHKRKEEKYRNLEQVKEEMAKREGYNKERWYRYYKFDYTDKNNYDYMIDTTDTSIEEVTENIIKILQKHLNTKPKTTKRTGSAQLKKLDAARKMIKKKDFIELDYIGKVKEDSFVFDTTNEAVAKENGLDSKESKYGPMIICVGEGQVLKGFDEGLVGKEPGKYTIDIKAEDAFGKKQANHIQLINTAKFRKQGVTPVPGLQVNIDNMVGIVKTVTGGRTMVDFNHPLASKELEYEIDIKKIVTDDNAKAKSLLELMFGPDVKVELKEGKLDVKTKMKLPEEVTEKIAERIKDLIPSVKDVVFTSTA